MPKGSDNPFPSVLIVEGTTPSSPASGDQRLFIDSATHLPKLVNSSGTVSTLAVAGSSAGALIGLTQVATPSYTTTSTTNADMDATNVKVTFTTPASGNVLIIVTSYGGITGAVHCTYQFREATTNIGSAAVVYQSVNGIQTSTQFYFSGVSAGSHTYKLGWSVDSGGTGNVYNVQPIVITAWAAP